MVRRLRQTLMDYMVIGISPALIMGMVGSLLFFLLTVFYHGQYAGAAELHLCHVHAGHRVDCAHLHGERYRVRVTLRDSTGHRDVPWPWPALSKSKDRWPASVT